MRIRKTPMVKALDLREKRRAAGYTADGLADILGVADGKYALGIESGAKAVTHANVVRAAYKFGWVTTEVEGVGRAWTIPAVEGARPAVVTDLQPGEVAWIALEEWREALQSIERLQAAIVRRDWDEVSRIYEQVVCDPQHAIALLAASLDRLNPVVGKAARQRHAEKLIRKFQASEKVCA